jgi:hypothetical protein
LEVHQRLELEQNPAKPSQENRVHKQSTVASLYSSEVKTPTTCAALAVGSPEFHMAGPTVKEDADSIQQGEKPKGKHPPMQMQ